MGSQSDWETMKHAAETLDTLGVAHETRVVSAHRTPDRMFEYAERAVDRGLMVIIAGAGGAAHLPGMVAAKTVVPVLGVPVRSKALSGVDSLLSIAQMPAGIPVATVAIGKAGAGGVEMGQLASAENALGKALGALNITMEAYPDLKASENMSQLSEEITTTENRVAYSRQGYNDAVTSFNIFRQSFPPVFFARKFGHPTDAELLEFDDSAEIQVAPKVSF